MVTTGVRTRPSIMSDMSLARVGMPVAGSDLLMAQSFAVYSRLRLQVPWICRLRAYPIGVLVIGLSLAHPRKRTAVSIRMAEEA